MSIIRKRDELINNSKLTIIPVELKHVEKAKSRSPFKRITEIENEEDLIKNKFMVTNYFFKMPIIRSRSSELT